jgi:HD-like signal output (HDOD) protein
MANLTPLHIDEKKFLYEHCSLPELPLVLTKLRQMIQSNEVGARKVAKLISTDASLVAQILKLVNSPYYSIPREISNLNIAVAYLGLNEIYRLAMTLSVVRNLTSKDKQAFKEIWFHSVFTAMCANYLARKFYPKIDLNELWSAAILHDIGKLVYLKFFPEHYKAMRQHSLAEGGLFCDSEKFFEFPSSAYFGTLLCDRWRLPQRVRAVCSTHTFYDFMQIIDHPPKDPFIPVVMISNLLTLMITDPLKPDLSDRITKTVINFLKITATSFPLLMTDVLELKENAQNLKII